MSDELDIEQMQSILDDANKLKSEITAQPQAKSKCRGLILQIAGDSELTVRRCSWDGEIVYDYLGGPLCRICGREVNDSEPQLAHAVAAKAAHIWIAPLQIWQLIQLPDDFTLVESITE